MPTDRLARLRSWPSGVYTDALARLWRAQHPPRVQPLVLPSSSVPADPLRVAVVCHVFYTELLDELQAVLQNLPTSTDFFLSVVDDEARSSVSSAFSTWADGLVDVRVVPNRGRDIAPKYVTFADVYRRGYDVVLFLHTKKSTYEQVGTPWRQHLYASLAGSQQVVDGVLEAFSRDECLGVVAPPHHESVAADTIWQGTFLHASRLARRMGLTVHRWAPPEFASGSMFWARPAALAAITGLALEAQDFPPEARQVTATNMHALERLVFVAAQHEGYRIGVLKQDGSGRSSLVEPMSDDSAPSPPPLRMWLRAAPPTLRRMSEDFAIRRRRFSPARTVPLIIRRVRRTLAGH